MNGIGRDVGRDRFPRLRRHAQIEPDRLQGETRRRQHLPPLFEDRHFPAAPRNPVPNQPPVPEMAAPALMRQPPFGARQRRQENRAVGAAEIEGRVDTFPGATRR